MTRAARLTTLFVQLAALRRSAPPSDLPDRLSDLFGRLRPLLAGEPESEFATAPFPLIDEARLRAMFAQLVEPLEQARRAGRLADVWDIAGLGRHEVRNAAALAALWDPRLCGTVAAEFLAAFFARLGAEDLPDRAALAAGYTIRTEDRPLGEASERVDIVVETSHHLVGIELKIDAPEGDGQLVRYRSALQARLGLRTPTGSAQSPPQLFTAALVYLGPRTPSDLATTHARWSDVAAAARSVVPRQVAERRFVHQLVAQFAAHVASF